MEIPIEPYSLPIGKASVVQTGRHITLVSYGRMLEFTLEAAKQLHSSGIEAEVIDLRTIKPLDIETLAASVRKTHFLRRR